MSTQLAPFPTSARVVVITQLCLLFFLVCWKVFLPFFGEHFEMKSDLYLYKNVMGVEDVLPDIEEHQESRTKLRRHKERFEALPTLKRMEIQEGFQELLASSSSGFQDKLHRSFQILFFHTHPFIQAWYFFAFSISMLLFFRIQGAVQASWLLPLLILLYLVHNQTHGFDRPAAQETLLYPNEASIVNSYINEPLSDEILEQKKQLTKGWQRFLVINYANAEPSPLPGEFENQVEDAEYNFNLALLKARNADRASAFCGTGQHRGSLPLQALWFAWNLFFAFFMTKKLPWR